MSPARLHCAVFLISATGIAYQVALMRILSIAQWHHFAYMIISIAMLGFGASGTVLSLGRGLVRGREPAFFRGALLAATPSLVACYALVQRIPFETFELTTQPGQAWYLLALYLVLAVPFFLIACCITLGFFLAPANIGRLYFFNMAGSGLGALLVAGLLYRVAPAHLPYVLTFAAAGAFAVAAWSGSHMQRCLRYGALAAVLAGVFLPGTVPIRVSEYKGLSYILQMPDAEVVAERYSPLAQTTAVSSSMLRETPGQISNYPMAAMGNLPPQIGLYFDAGAVSPVHRFEGDLEPFAFLDYVTSALPYRLLDEPAVAVLGAGGGTDVLSALWHSAQSVTAVEVDPVVLDLVETELAEFSGGLYRQPGVTPVIAEGRGFLQASEDRFDLIQLPLFGSFSAAAAGVLALNESYLYTVEALALFLDRLTDDGILAVNCWLKTPPRDAVKLFATAVEACERMGFEDPARHLVFIRSWNNATILVSRSPLTPARIEAVRAFSADRFLDLSHYPGITEEEVNQYTLLEEETYYQAARAILSPGREAFYSDYPFYVRPATDDRPYFFRFLRWSVLPQLLRGEDMEWLPFVEWGYIVLMGTVAQSFAAGLVLILLPLVLLARRPALRGASGWTLVYFAALGLAFMFLEIAFIQIFMRFLAYPIYAVTVVLTSFLIFSGLGSLAAGHLRHLPPPRLLAAAAGGIALFSACYLAFLPGLFNAGAGWSDAAKILLSVLLLGPLAFCMGIPFPAGLQLVSDRANALVPWAWGVNGCMSVLGATLATFTAIHFGFQVLVTLAVALYLVAATALAMLYRKLAPAT